MIGKKMYICCGLKITFFLFSQLLKEKEKEMKFEINKI